MYKPIGLRRDEEPPRGAVRRHTVVRQMSMSPAVAVVLDGHRLDWLLDDAVSPKGSLADTVKVVVESWDGPCRFCPYNPRDDG